MSQHLDEPVAEHVPSEEAVPAEAPVVDAAEGPNRIEVLVCVALSGMRRGRRVWVDPDDPWMANAIASGNLVAVGAAG